MPTAERFQDLVAWQRARVLTRDIYALTRAGAFANDRGLADQIRRASVSVMANLAEGFERRRRTEFFRYVEIAKASCAEVLSHLYVALDVEYVTKGQFEAIETSIGELQRILGGLRRSLVPLARNSELGTRNS
jgi:four helix bundle protein